MFDMKQIAAERGREFLQRASLRMEDAMGPAIVAAMDNPDITEVMLNCDGALFMESQQRGMYRAGTLAQSNAYTIVKTLASLADKTLDEAHPLLSGEIPFNGSRIEIQIPPAVRAPSFTIRKHNALNLPLSALVETHMLSARTADFLREILLRRESIVVSGGTGTGKTTLVNALINELALLCPQERIINVEDTAELKVTLPNRLNLTVCAGTGMDALVRSALRSRPDRIVVGEIRGAEALDLLDGFSTGHSGGFATVHAGSPEQALKRLTLLVSRHEAAPRCIEPMIAMALDYIVQLERRPERHVAQIARVKGYREPDFVLAYQEI